MYESIKPARLGHLISFEFPKSFDLQIFLISIIKSIWKGSVIVWLISQIKMLIDNQFKVVFTYNLTNMMPEPSELGT